jgi:uncharacterized protein YgiM (DUF1202 family)
VNRPPVPPAPVRSTTAMWEQELAAREQTIARISADNKRLRSDLTAKEAEAEELREALKRAKRSLVTAELEVERLSAILRDRNTAVISRSLGKELPPAAPARPVAVARPVQAAPRLRAPAAAQPSQPEDMPIATVVAKVAHLRSGPGTNNSPLMSVERGARLTVEEHVEGWYRVVAPTGKRAWIESSLVRFGKDSLSGPTATVRIEGYRSELDQQQQKPTPDSF